MGGDCWRDTGPYQRDLAAAFRQAQTAELALRGLGERTVEELWDDPGWQEYVCTGGTATVLDFPLMIDPADPDDGPFMRPLTDDEIRAWCPDGRPSQPDWTDALDSGALEYPGRSQGRCAVLYTDGRPAGIGYWGVTTD